MDKNYNLFLDDNRKPSDVTWVELPLVPWVVVRGCDTFISTISRYGLPRIVSFDHDLCDEHYERYFKAKKTGAFDYNNLTVRTGLDAAKWLVKYCEMFHKLLPECHIHTRNHFGEANIREVLKAFKPSKKAIKNLTDSQ